MFSVVKESKDELSASSVAGESGRIPIEVVSVDKGIPVRRKAHLSELTAEHAWIEIEKELAEGEVIALVIREADRRIFDLFNFEEVPSSTRVTIMTRGKVDDVSSGSGPGKSRALIRFQGSMRIVGR
jgi:hypothetical protein